MGDVVDEGLMSLDLFWRGNICLGKWAGQVCINGTLVLDVSGQVSMNGTLLWMLVLSYHSMVWAAFGEVATEEEGMELWFDFEMLDCWGNERNDSITILLPVRYESQFDAILWLTLIDNKH